MQNERNAIEFKRKVIGPVSLSYRERADNLKPQIVLFKLKNSRSQAFFKL